MNISLYLISVRIRKKHASIFLNVNVLLTFHSRDEQLSATEMTAKLEPAFLCGLRCPQIQIRMKFFEV